MGTDPDTEGIRSRESDDSDHGIRIVRLEMSDQHQDREIRGLKKATGDITDELSKGAMAIALMQADVRRILWVIGAIAVPVLGALGFSLLKLVNTGSP